MAIKHFILNLLITNNWNIFSIKLNFRQNKNFLYRRDLKNKMYKTYFVNWDNKKVVEIWVSIDIYIKKIQLLF